MKTTLFRNADWIITMDDERTRHRNADLLVSGKEILAIGKGLEAQYRGRLAIDEVIDASGRVLIPGFVNTHHHTWQSLIRNIKATQGMALEPWLKVMYEVYKDLNQDVARAGVYASLGDCMKTGCTTSNDLWYPHPIYMPKLMDAEIEAAAEIGIRFHPVRAYHSVTSDIVPPEVVDSTEGVMADAERLVKTYHDRSRFSMCQVGIGPSIAQYETEEIIRAISRSASTSWCTAIWPRAGMKRSTPSRPLAAGRRSGSAARACSEAAFIMRTASISTTAMCS